MSAYTLTDDPTEPCAYCVQWEQPDGSGHSMDNIHSAVPWLPTGPVDRMYRGVHGECAQSVAAYVDGA